MLKIENVSVTFQKGTINEKKALDNVTLELNEGDFVCVIGSNGAGKSTLLNCVSGNVENESGSVYLNNKNITKDKEHKRAKNIGRVFQDPLKGSAADMNIEENIRLAYGRGNKKSSIFALGLSRKEKEHIQKSLKELKLGLEERMQDKVGLLSGGQRQALTLLMATINTPELLLLDEHTAALDPTNSNIVMEMTKKIVEEHKLTTLMITHNISQALNYGNRLLVMANGKIVYDIKEEEKKSLSVEDVMKLYQEISNQEFSDSMLLSEG